MNNKKFSFAGVLLMIAVLTVNALCAPTEGKDYTIDKNSNTVNILTVNALKNVYQIDVSSLSSKVTYKLANDIVVSSKEQTSECTTNWSAENTNLPANAILDGNGHTVSGICMKANNAVRLFLFNIDNEATVQNISFENIYMENAVTSTTIYPRVSLFNGSSKETYSSGTYFNNVNFNKIYIRGANYTSLILSGSYSPLHFDHVNAKNITLSTNSATGTTDIGGFIADYGAYSSPWNSNISITNCSFDGNISNESTRSNGYVYVGGFIGYAYTKKLEISKSSFKGNIIGGSKGAGIGGLAGYLPGLDKAKDILITETEVNADVSGDQRTGGFIGSFEISTNGAGASAEVSNSSYTGKITGRTYVGGLFGNVKGGDKDLLALKNISIASPTSHTGSLIEATQENVGGVAGSFYCTVDMSNVSVEGKISTQTTYNTVGGIFGYCGLHSSFEKSSFIGSIDAPNALGIGNSGSSHNSLSKIYVINLSGSGSEDLYNTSDDMTDVKNIAYGTSLTDDITLYENSSSNRKVKPTTPSFAWSMGMTYIPNKHNNLPIIGEENSTHRIYAEYGSNKLFEYYTDENGKIAYDANNKAVSSINVTYPNDWPEANKPKMTTVYKYDRNFNMSDYEIAGCNVYIKSADRLQNLTALTAEMSGCKEITFVLANDITLSKDEQKEGCATNWNNNYAVLPDNATFDGDGHTISGVCLSNADSSNTYLFKISANTHVKNINFENVRLTSDYDASYISLFYNSYPPGTYNLFSKINFNKINLIAKNGTGAAYAGLLLARGNNQELSIDSIIAEGINLDINGGNAGSVGLLVGESGNVTNFSNIEIKGSISSNSINVGGLIGWLSNSSPKASTIKNILVEANITTKSSNRTAGLVSELSGDAELENISVSSTIKAENSNIVSGIIGDLYLGKSIYLKNISFSGYIDAQGTYIAGILAYNQSYPNLYLEDIHVSTPGEKPESVLINASGTNYCNVASVLGQISGEILDIKNVTSIGIVEANGKEVTIGGFGSNLSWIQKTILTNASFKGKIKSNATDEGRAGFIGYVNSNISIRNVTANAGKDNVLIDVSNISDVGGLLGKVDFLEEIKNANISGDIIVTSKSTNAGGLIGYLSSGYRVTMDSSSYKGSLNIDNSSETDATSISSVGGLIGQDYASIIKITNVKAITAKDSPSEKLINLKRPSGTSYVGGIAGWLKYEFSMENATAVGEIDVSSTGDVYLAGISGFGGTSAAGNILKSYYIGKLTANSPNKHLNALLYNENPDVFASFNYVIDFSGSVTKLSNSPENCAAIGLGTTPDKDAFVYLGNRKVNAGKPQSAEFANMLRTFKYDPNENNGYPIVGNEQRGSALWIEGTDIVADIYTEYGKAYFRNGTMVNNRTISKLPNPTINVSQNKIQFISWITKVDDILNHYPVLTWNSDSIATIIDSLSPGTHVVFARDTITIDLPKIFARTEDYDEMPYEETTHTPIWDGQDYKFSADKKFPTVYITPKYSEEFMKNTTWTVALPEGASSKRYFANSLTDLSGILTKVVHQDGADKNDLDVTLYLPDWHDGEVDEYIDAGLYVTYTNLKTQDISLSLTLPGVSKEHKVSVTQSVIGQILMLPRPSKIKFNDNNDLNVIHTEVVLNENGDYIGEKTISTIVKANGTYDVPEKANNLRILPHFIDSIKIDTTGIGAYSPIITFNIPKTFESGVDSVAFPIILSTKACFDGWNIEYKGDKASNAGPDPEAAPPYKKMAKAPVIPENAVTVTDEILTPELIDDDKMKPAFIWRPNRFVYGSIKATPLFNKEPCNFDVELHYAETEGINDAAAPKDLKWTVSLGDHSFTTEKKADGFSVVTLPVFDEIPYTIKAESASELTLMSEDPHGNYVLENGTYMSYTSYNQVSAMSQQNIEDKYETATWLDENGKLVYKILFTGGNHYNITNGTPTSDYSNSPKKIYRKKGKLYYFQNQDGVIWQDNGANAGTYEAKEIPWLDNVKFYVTDGKKSVSIDSANETWKNVFIKNKNIKTDDSLPSVAAIFENVDHNAIQRQYYLSKAWTFANGVRRDATSISTIEQLLDTLFTYQGKSSSGEIHLYANFAQKAPYVDESENVNIPPCNKENCQLELFNTTIKSSSEITFSGDVFGEMYEFTAGNYTNVPKISKIRFLDTSADSLMIVHTDDNDDVVEYNVVSSQIDYTIPEKAADLALTLKVQPVEESRHTLTVKVPDSKNGILFRQFEIPTSYSEGMPIPLPKLGSVDVCFVGYEALDANGNVDEITDIQQNEDGNFLWRIGQASSNLVVQATTENDQCKVENNTVTVKTASDVDASVSLVHFGDVLKPMNGVYQLPANGIWPIVVEAATGSNIRVDSLLFNEKSYANGDEILFAEGGTITLYTSVIRGDVSYSIADVNIQASGSAIRLSFRTEGTEYFDYLPLSVTLFNGDSVIAEKHFENVHGDDIYAEIYRNLRPGTYHAVISLGDLEEETEEWTIEESLNIVKAGSWGMRSLANVSDDFKIPESDEGAIYYWDETNAIGDFMQYKKVRDVKDLKPTVGYWYVSSEESDLKRTPSDTTEKELSWNLKNKFSGWNLVANPYSWNLSLGETGDIDDPEDDRDVYMRWNPETLSYDTASTIGAYEGMWIHTESDHEMVLNTEPVFEESIEKDTNAGKKQRALNKTSVSKSSWSLRLILAGEKGLTDALNVVGIGSKNIEVMDPPAAMEGGVNLSIENGNRSLAKSIKNSLDEASWNLNLSAASLQKGKLSFEGLEKLSSAGLYAALVMDGKVVPLTAGEDIPVNLSTVTKTAVLKVSASPVIQLALGVSGLRFKPAGSQLMVNFDLGEVAASKVEIRLVDTRGNVVSSASDDASAGSHSVALEKPAATGVYILRVNAGKNGTQMKIRL